MGIEEFLFDRAEKQGIEIGIEIGIEKGIEKGIQEEGITIARELKKEGLAIEFIAKITKLPGDEIEKL